MDSRLRGRGAALTPLPGLQEAPHHKGRGAADHVISPFPDVDHFSLGLDSYWYLSYSRGIQPTLLRLSLLNRSGNGKVSVRRGSVGNSAG